MTQVIPEKALNQHIAILGKTGAGKSYLARGVVEHLLNTNRRVCIIDPKGDWFGLRLSASGKSAGFPVVIFGGAHGDLPINAQAGGQIAELVATGNRPTILDMSELSIVERTRLFMEFAAGLFRHNKGPLWLVIDEVHNFAHQGKVHDVDAGKMLHWANRLASEGRGKGIQIIMASQRPQKVAKDTLTCAETLVAMRVVHNLDRAAIKEWLDGAGDKEKSADVLNSLASMERGQAWVWSPEIGYFNQAKAPPIKTYDSMSPAEDDAEPLKGWATVNLDEVRQKLAHVVKEAEANDPKLLKREIADLKRQLAAKPAPAAAAADPKAIEKAVSAAVAARDREWQSGIREREKIIDSLKGRMGKAVQLLAVNGEAVPKHGPPAAVKSPERLVSDTLAIPTRRQAIPSSQSQPAERAKSRNRSLADAGSSIDLGKAERAILTAFYWLKDEDATPAKVAFYSDYAAGSSTTNNALGRLRHGLLNGWRITAEGESLVESWGVKPKPVGPELLEMLRSKLSRAERAMLDALAAHYPNRLDADQLSEACGYANGSSTFNNAIGKLRTLEAAEGYVRDGGTKAADVFFE